MRDRRPADGLRPAARADQIAVARVPAKDQAAPHRLAVLQLRRPRRHRGRLSAGRRRRPLRRAQRALRHRRLRPARRGQSKTSIDCKVTRSTLGIYSQPVPTPQTLDRRAYIAKDRAYSTVRGARTARILPHVSTANVARDMDVLRAAVGDAQAQLPRLLLRHLPGRDLRRACSRTLPGAGAGRRARRRRVHQRPVSASPSRRRPSSGRSTASSGVRGRPGRVPRLRRQRSVDGLRRAGRQARGAADRRGRLQPDPRPVDGDDIRMARSTLYAKGAWPLLAQALAEAAGRRRDAAPARDRRGVLRPRPGRRQFDPTRTATSPSAPPSSATHRDVRSSYLRPGRPSCGTTTRTSGSTAATSSSTSGSGRPARGRLLRPLQASRPPRRRRWSSTRPTTRRRPTAAPGSARALGNARLLTMAGDGHTAYGGNSPCIDRLTAYLSRPLPRPGTVCRSRCRSPRRRRTGRGSAAAAAVVAGVRQRR